MQSRRDQVEARTDQLSRLTSALMAGSPELPERPERRDITAFTGGILVALLVVGVFAALGLFLGPREAAWRADGTLVVDKGTGARYVYLSGVLRPVVNLASAQLLISEAAGTSVELSPVYVGSSALADVPRGAPIGIPGYPDLLPLADTLNQGAWRVCAARTPDDAPATQVSVGAGQLDPIGRDAAFLVTDGTADYLLWHGRRLRLGGRLTVGMLGYSDIEPVLVAPSLLAALPKGPDLAPQLLSDRGDPAPAGPDGPTTVGQLYQLVDGGAGYIMLSDGLAELTGLDLALEMAEPGAPQPRPLTVADLGRLSLSPSGYRQGEFPVVPPEITDVSGGRRPCLQYPRSDGGDGVDLVTAVPDPGVVPGDALAAPVVVRVRPGGGALVSGGAGTVLIAEDGLSYPVSDLDTLGYDEDQVLTVPAGFLDLVPSASGRPSDPIS